MYVRTVRKVVSRVTSLLNNINNIAYRFHNKACLVQYDCRNRIVSDRTRKRQFSWSSFTMKPIVTLRVRSSVENPKEKQKTASSIALARTISRKVRLIPDGNWDRPPSCDRGSFLYFWPSYTGNREGEGGRSLWGARPRGFGRRPANNCSCWPNLRSALRKKNVSAISADTSCTRTHPLIFWRDLPGFHRAEPKKIANMNTWKCFFFFWKHF